MPRSELWHPNLTFRIQAMANEISTSLAVTVSYSGQSAAGTVAAQSDLTTTFIGNEQIIGITAETFDLGDVGASPKFLFVKNLDSTNFITVDAVNTFDAFPQVILPGQGVYLAPPSGTVYCIADTAPCKVFVCSAG